MPTLTPAVAMVLACTSAVSGEHTDSSQAGEAKMKNETSDELKPSVSTSSSSSLLEKPPQESNTSYREITKGWSKVGGMGEAGTDI